MMASKVLVTGASGKIGSELLKILSKKSIDTRAAVRDTSKIELFNLDHVESYKFDYTVNETYSDLFNDVDKLFLLLPSNDPDFVEVAGKLISLAKNAGLSKIVFLSSMGVEDADESPLFEAEWSIRSSGIPYTILRPNWFMQNFNTFHLKEILENNSITVPAGDASTSFVDTRDIAEAAAIVLFNRKYDNKEYTITGPEALNYFEIAGILSEVCGREIKYNNLSDEHYMQYLIDLGADKMEAKMMLWMYQAVRRGEVARVDPVLPEILFKEARQFRQYAFDYKNSWVQK